LATSFFLRAGVDRTGVGEDFRLVAMEAL
jgi:hypothetical protein